MFTATPNNNVQSVSRDCLRRRVGACVCRERRRRRRSRFQQNVEELLPHGLRPPQPPAGVHRVRGDAVPSQSDEGEGSHRRGPPRQPDHAPYGKTANPGRLGRGGIPEGTLLHQPAPAAQWSPGGRFDGGQIETMTSANKITPLIQLQLFIHLIVFFFFFVLNEEVRVFHSGNKLPSIFPFC